MISHLATTVQNFKIKFTTARTLYHRVSMEEPISKQGLAPKDINSLLNNRSIRFHIKMSQQYITSHRQLSSLTLISHPPCIRSPKLRVRARIPMAQQGKRIQGFPPPQILSLSALKLKMKRAL
jgi:hypothetical protein